MDLKVFLNSFRIYLLQLAGNRFVGRRTIVFLKKFIHRFRPEEKPNLSGISSSGAVLDVGHLGVERMQAERESFQIVVLDEAGAQVVLVVSRPHNMGALT